MAFENYYTALNRDPNRNLFLDKGKRPLIIKKVELNIPDKLGSLFTDKDKFFDYEKVLLSSDPKFSSYLNYMYPGIQLESDINSELQRANNLIRGVLRLCIEARVFVSRFISDDYRRWHNVWGTAVYDYMGPTLADGTPTWNALFRSLAKATGDILFLGFRKEDFANIHIGWEITKIKYTLKEILIDIALIIQISENFSILKSN